MYGVYACEVNDATNAHATHFFSSALTVKQNDTCRVSSHWNAKKIGILFWSHISGVKMYRSTITRVAQSKLWHSAVLKGKKSLTASCVKMHRSKMIRGGGAIKALTFRQVRNPPRQTTAVISRI